MFHAPVRPISTFPRGWRVLLLRIHMVTWGSPAPRMLRYGAVPLYGQPRRAAIGTDQPWPIAARLSRPGIIEAYGSRCCRPDNKETSIFDEQPHRRHFGSLTMGDLSRCCRRN